MRNLPMPHLLIGGLYLELYLSLRDAYGAHCVCLFEFHYYKVHLPMVFKCPLCERYASFSIKGVIRHLGIAHSHEAGFRVECPVNDCPRTYCNFNSYKRHMYSRHRCLLDDSVVQRSSEPCSSFESGGSLISDDGIHTDNQDGDTMSSSAVSYCSLHERKKQGALFALKARHVHKVSQSSIGDLMCDFTTLLESAVATLKARVLDIVEDSSSEENSALGCRILEEFEKQDILEPFGGLKTEFLQKQYFAAHLHLTTKANHEPYLTKEPVERKLGRRIRSTMKNARPYYKQVWECVYDVPLLDSLKQLLSDEFILNQVLNGHQRSDGLLQDYCDGLVYKSHPLYSVCPQSLEIIVYYDDVEICNPLGSRAKKHKLALFYYTLGNLHPKYRSSTLCIQLLAVVRSSALQEYGPDVILEPIMEDIKSLEKDTGVTMCLNGKMYNFRGTVSVVPADNLASHYLGGYKSLSSALRKCRHCMATADDMAEKFTSELFQPRSRETHSNHCSSLNGPLGSHFATTYGVVRNSSLNFSRYFHVTEGLVPDVMHDVLEGSLPYEVKEMLRVFIAKKYFKLSYLTSAMENFAYLGVDARNKPIPIDSKILDSTDHKLKQTATQMWSFGRLLPLIIGDKIPKDDKHWQNFLLLLCIMDYLFAPVLSQDCIGHLKDLIQEHHEAFVVIYVLCSVTPKIHYMIHYPEIIERFGPLIHLCCLRFEAKHNYFKDLAHRVKCFKNIAKTMAQNHQEYLCYRLSNSTYCTSPFDASTKIGPAFGTAVSELPYKDDVLELFSEYDAGSKVTRLAWVEIHGTKYHKEGVLVIKNNLLPMFGKITDIFVMSNCYYFVCTMLHTVCFTSHFHAYEVTEGSDSYFKITTISEIADYNVYNLYKLSSHPNCFFVPMKYHIIENI